MKRLIDWHLERWKEDPFRKPLIIRGARQIGKTFSVRNFGKKFANIVEVNFEKSKEVKTIFSKNLDPLRIISELKALFKQPIEIGETLLFFDEIQECPDALTSLRYFYENLPKLHLIAAGSLLDFAIEKVGIPVGRVTSLYMYPLSFIEFLVATGYSIAASSILKNDAGTPMSEAIHDLLLDLIGQYLTIGGLPEAVSLWVKTQDVLEVQKVLNRLADTYKQDFDKYAKRYQIKYLDVLFNQIPRFIGCQFKYSLIHGQYQKRELAPCLDLLCRANIFHRVHHSAGNALPLGSESNFEWFKILFLDVALCQIILGADISSWLLNSRETIAAKGNIVETFVGQELLCYSAVFAKTDLYFWKIDKAGSQAEVDYLYPFQNRIVPLEAKSKDGRSLKSLHRFLETHPHCHSGIRLSSANYSIFEKIDSRPLYAICSLAHPDQRFSLDSLVKE